MSDITPDDIAVFVAETDQDKAAVRDLVRIVRRHWADNSGCPLPKCPSGTISRELQRTDHRHLQHLFMAALVLLAEHAEQAERQHQPGWAVIDEQHVRHDFTGPEKAMGYAIDRAWTDRQIELESPKGERWLVLRRHPEVIVVAARKIGILR
ncbi:hypothetical protein AB0N38_14095 [Micromonospora aurantiaca]|uniref:hypothetical protein n=1 Tax=Micromonospora aurantiaca (nom. illeg.) TaxID=47850 RepID=UPI003416B652